MQQSLPPVVTTPEARCPKDNIQTQSGLMCERVFILPLHNENHMPPPIRTVVQDVGD